MKRIVLTMAALGGLLLVTSSPANAADRYWYGGHRGHHRLHDDLDHRAFHRGLIHRDAHRYPMSWREHGRLHDDLEHDAYHDSLRHRSYHRRHYYGGYGRYSGRGFGVHGRGFSIWFGR